MPQTQQVRFALERMLCRLVLVALAALFVLVALPVLWNLLSPFIIGLMLAAALEPLVSATQKRLRARRGLAVAFWVLASAAAALALLYWFSSFAVVQVISAAENATGILSGVITTLRSAADRVLGMARNMPDSLSLTIETSLNNAFQSISDAGVRFAGSLVNGAVNVAASLPYAFIYANFLLLAVWFIANRYAGIKTRLSGMSGGERNIRMLRQSAGRGLVGYVRVQLLFSLLTCLISWVFFQAVGFQYAFLIGFLAALLELIPQFGCGILYIPWSVISFIIGSTRNGWLVLGLYLGYTLLRRVTEPALLGNNLGVSPLASLVGMFVGMRMGGVLGLVVGPIAMVVLVSAVRSHLFASVAKDTRTIAVYMKERWRRGEEHHAG